MDAFAQILAQLLRSLYLKKTSRRSVAVISTSDKKNLSLVVGG